MTTCNSCHNRIIGQQEEFGFSRYHPECLKKEQEAKPPLPAIGFVKGKMWEEGNEIKSIFPKGIFKEDLNPLKKEPKLQNERVKELKEIVRHGYQNK